MTENQIENLDKTTNNDFRYVVVVVAMEYGVDEDTGEHKLTPVNFTMQYSKLERKKALKVYNQIKQTKVFEFERPYGVLSLQCPIVEFIDKEKYNEYMLAKERKETEAQQVEESPANQQE